jgi:maltose O-acetyltransferase
MFSSVNYRFHLLLYHGFARYLPASTMPLGFLWREIRCWVCRPLFVHCGENVNIERGASIGLRTISIGSNSGIGIRASVGDGTNIGSNVMMGPEVLILTQNHRIAQFDRPMLQQGFGPVTPVHIEDDVWIGARAIILPGVRIGSGSVIGAGAVVSRDVPRGAVAVGNPARTVRYRHHTSPAIQTPKCQIPEWVESAQG